MFTLVFVNYEIFLERVFCAPSPAAPGDCPPSSYATAKVKAIGEQQPSNGYIESAEQSRTAEQNKISKLTVKLQIISTEHDCRM